MRRAVLVIDVLSRFEFDGGLALARRLARATRQLSIFLRRARQREVPVIYANDNLGRWRSSQAALIEACVRRGGDAARIATALRPAADDYFVIKPRHSAFYATPLELLLDDLLIQELVLTGTATNSCVLATAADAHLRGYSLWIASDATVAESSELEHAALGIMRRTFGATVADTRNVRFPRRRKVGK
jgi:nicotinamidase-related amidase